MSLFACFFLFVKILFFKIIKLDKKPNQGDIVIKTIRRNSTKKIEHLLNKAVKITLLPDRSLIEGEEKTKKQAEDLIKKHYDSIEIKAEYDSFDDIIMMWVRFKKGFWLKCDFEQRKNLNTLKQKINTVQKITENRKLKNGIFAITEEEFDKEITKFVEKHRNKNIVHLENLFSYKIKKDNQVEDKKFTLCLSHTLEDKINKIKANTIAENFIVLSKEKPSKKLKLNIELSDEEKIKGFKSKININNDYTKKRLDLQHFASKDEYVAHIEKMTKDVLNCYLKTQRVKSIASKPLSLKIQSDLNHNIIFNSFGIRNDAHISKKNQVYRVKSKCNKYAFSQNQRVSLEYLSCDGFINIFEFGLKDTMMRKKAMDVIRGQVEMVVESIYDL